MGSKHEDCILNIQAGNSPTGTASETSDIRHSANQQEYKAASTRHTSHEMPKCTPESQDSKLLDSPKFEYQDADIALEVDLDGVEFAAGEIPTSSNLSATFALHSSILEYGRSYHRYRCGKYMLPNDEREQSRLDLQHHLFLISLHGALHLAPVEKGVQNVLDIATGTGIWATEFALKYPSASVIGTDLSPIQPQFVPPNCHFEIYDAEDEWVYSYKFDYIHGRCLMSCFKDFPSIVRKAFEALRPGGHFELQDICPLSCLDDSWEGTELQRWRNLIIMGSSAMGMDWMKAIKYKQYMIDTGFENVQENYLDGIPGFTMRLLNKALGMTTDEIKILLDGAKNCLQDRNIHCITPVYVVHGRRPIKACE